MAEEELLVVVLNRNDSASGFGFSLLGKPGLPPIIYQILEDSPAAESGEVEVGDVILKVNETDVNRFTTKEVLKCLRLSEDPVTLKIKRDPKIKASVQRLCATNLSPPAGGNCPTSPAIAATDVVDFNAASPTTHHVEMAPVHQHLQQQRYCNQQQPRLLHQQQLSSGSSGSDSENNCCLGGDADRRDRRRGEGEGEEAGGACRSPLVYTKHKYTTSTTSNSPSPKASSNHHHQQHRRPSPPTSNGCRNNQSPSPGRNTKPCCPALPTTDNTPLLCSSGAGGTTRGDVVGEQLQQQQAQDRLQWEPLGGATADKGGDKPKFEAFMMTGEHILKISNTQQASLLPKQQKKNDSGGRYHNSHAHHLRHTPYPPLSSQQQSPASLPPYHTTNHQHHPHQQRSVPNSPNEHDLGSHHHHHYHHAHHQSHHNNCCCQSQPNSAHTSPVLVTKQQPQPVVPQPQQECNNSDSVVFNSGYFVRTSRSEDQLQEQGGGIMSAVDIDLEEDVTSSLNTLLDTRGDAMMVAEGGNGGNGSGSGSGSSNNSDRIVWTYNAPVSGSNPQPPLCHTLSNGSNSTNASSHSNNSNGAAAAATGGTAGQVQAPGSHNGTSSPSSNSLRSTSPASPTSVSSSIMSSHSGGGGGGGGGGRGRLGVQQQSENGYSTHSGNNHQHHAHHLAGSSQQHYQQQQYASNSNNRSGGGGDYSISEAVSNISSPDYHDADADSMVGCCMEVSDHSDSDSTLLVSEPRQHHRDRGNGGSKDSTNGDGQHRIVIQVKGAAGDGNGGGGGNSGATTRRGSWSTRRGSAEDGGAANSRTELSGSGGSLSLRNSRDQMSSDSYDYTYDDPDSDETVLRDCGRGPGVGGAGSSPPISEDESDIDSLHSFHHYSPKAVDLPSAIRLAKRLYCLDGFKKSDVSRHLSKANEFSRAVADEYLRYFSFDQDTLDLALRKFLKQFSLTGETQERERVLVHFSKRFLDCNPGSFNSQDAVHTLTCAIMLLNTDLHGPNMNRKMTCNEFIDNLAGLNENENFPREVLKQLYHAIKNFPLEWALDEDVDENASQQHSKNMDSLLLSGNPFLDVPCPATSTEHKKGYVMRKCCYEQNAKRTPFHKRSWKMFYVTLRDLILYLHKDEASAANAHSSAVATSSGGGGGGRRDHLHNAVRVHHALASPATDYTKKQHVFRLETADQAEYLFQTSDSKELQSWIDTLNFVCARYSAPPLEAAVGSQKKFQRPLLPCSHTKLSLREQLKDHEERVFRLDEELKDHSRNPPERGAKALVVQNYKEKEVYLNFELKRYRCYANILRTKITLAGDLIAAASSAGGNSQLHAASAHQQQHCGGNGSLSLVETSIGEMDELLGTCAVGEGRPLVMGTIGQYIPLGGVPINPSSGSPASTTTYQLLDQPPINSVHQLTPPPVPERRSPPSPTTLHQHHANSLQQQATTTNRYSYRQAIYATTRHQQQQQQSAATAESGGGGGDIG